MACFERPSPALKQILLKLFRAEKAEQIDHHLYEFGSVEYHIQCAAKDQNHVYLSVSIPLLLTRGVMLSHGLSDYTIRMVKGLCSPVIEIVEPPRQGYQLTLRLNFSNISPRKGVKIIMKICTVRAVILTSELKEILRNISLSKTSRGMYKTIKFVYHPRESFYVVRQYKKISVVYPMRFKENSDWIMATTFFQELMDVGSLKAFSKVPQCSWSPVPPPELRGEPFEDLTTDGGFVSFDIYSCHVKGRKLNKTIWSLLNFNAYVKYFVKSTRCFIQRRMRSRLESLVEALRKPIKEDMKMKNVQGSRRLREPISVNESRALRPRCGSLFVKIKRIRWLRKLRRFCHFRPRWLRIPSHFRRRWLRIPNISSAMKYQKLD